MWKVQPKQYLLKIYRKNFKFSQLTQINLIYWSIVTFPLDIFVVCLFSQLQNKIEKQFFVSLFQIKSKRVKYESMEMALSCFGEIFLTDSEWMKWSMYDTGQRVNLFVIFIQISGIYGNQQLE